MHPHHAATGLTWAAPVAMYVLVVAAYLLAVTTSRRRGRSWPWWRTVLWLLGGLACLAAVAGPLARWSDDSFVAHMVGHVLLGMLCPLLLVLAAPVTVALRALPVAGARVLVRILGSRVVRFVSHPVVAGAADLGGVWLLYTTPLYGQLDRSPWLHLLVHAHVLVWGYLFTAAVVGVDPNRHRRGPFYRSVVLIVFMAGHGIVAKLVYAAPPAGVPAGEGEAGAMVMYYGGDFVDVLLVLLLCRRWYVRSRPVPDPATAT